MPPAVSLLGISARREEKICDHGYFMNLGTNDRWADTNTESPHRLSVPFSGIRPLFVVVNVDCNPLFPCWAFQQGERKRCMTMVIS